MNRIECNLDFDIVNTQISVCEIVGDITEESDSEKRVDLYYKYRHLDRLLFLKIDAKINRWEEFSFKRMHEETDNLCAADYWKFEELWEFEMPELFKMHEEKRQKEIIKAKGQR